MKKHLSTIFLILVFLVGLSVLLYPSFSDWWNSRNQSRAIVNYEELLKTAGSETFDEEFAAADAYNEALSGLGNPLVDYEKVEGYEDILNLGGNGIMGYITIPKIGVELPLYHGTSSPVLNIAIGHMEGTSLPVGGLGTHCVLSGHRGLPSAKLFSNLDRLEEGDTFTLTVLNRQLVYEVDQVRIVLPEETEELAMDPQNDYCTLLTCTPYGINTHRLLVRGVRLYGEKTILSVQPEAYQMDSLLLAPVAAAPILLLLLIYLLVRYRKKKA